MLLGSERAQTSALGRATTMILLTTFFAAAVAVSARVTLPLPFTPVPITLQVLMVVLTGLLLGSRLGALSLLEYLGAGLAGAPVFQGGNSGVPYLFGPTGGYLVGFVAMAFVTGFVWERGPQPGRAMAFAASLLGLILLYLFGGIWLGFWYGLAQAADFNTALSKAWAGGVLPFIGVDLLKVLVAAAVVEGGRTFVGRFR